MELHVEQTLIEYLEKYGYLFENDASIILEDLEVEKIKEKYEKQKEKLKQNKDSYIKQLLDFLKKVGENAADELREKIEEKIRKMRVMYLAKKQLLNMKQTIELKRVKGGKSAVLISGTALASLMIFSSFKIYMDEKKNISKRCGNLSGIKKDKCVSEFYKNALFKRLYFLKKSVMKCKYSKDPLKCRGKIDEEILKVQQKLKKFGSDVGKQMIKHFD